MSPYISCIEPPYSAVMLEHASTASQSTHVTPIFEGNCYQVNSPRFTVDSNPKWCCTPLIGILPVRDAAETISVGSMLTQGTNLGDRSSKNQTGLSDSHKLDGKSQQEPIHWHTRI